MLIFTIYIVFVIQNYFPLWLVILCTFAHPIFKVAYHIALSFRKYNFLHLVHSQWLYSILCVLVTWEFILFLCSTWPNIINPLFELLSHAYKGWCFLITTPLSHDFSYFSFLSRGCNISIFILNNLTYSLIYNVLIMSNYWTKPMVTVWIQLGSFHILTKVSIDMEVTHLISM